MIELGSCDGGVDDAACKAYLQSARQLMTGADLALFNTALRGEGEWKRLTPVAGAPVVDIQTFLRATAFFPSGTLDGICGYRTTSAIRLFQEYVRTTVPGMTDFLPDGIWGPKCAERAKQWPAGTKADWAQWSATNPSPECAPWLKLLAQVKAKYVASPTPMLKKVDEFSKPTDTVKRAEWDFDPKKIHLIGIRRHEDMPKSENEQRFDDLFVLLIKGVAFTFFGSTEPGHTNVPAKGYPFLVIGQHRYRFGWHHVGDAQKIFQALKPATGAGVLVIRSQDLSLQDADLPAVLENAVDINVHWGGSVGAVVHGWSEGCQVIVGKAYIDHRGQLRNCAGFAALNTDTLGTTTPKGVKLTKGAYTLLSDLATALSGATPGDNIVHYMLIPEADLALVPEARQKATEALTLFGNT
jgi:hypothetical protein